MVERRRSCGPVSYSLLAICCRGLSAREEHWSCNAVLSISVDRHPRCSWERRTDCGHRAHSPCTTAKVSRLRACKLAALPACCPDVLCVGLQLPRQCIWELEMKEPSGGSWHTIHPVHASLSAAADRLTPGTKYIFRARAGEVLLNWIHSQRSCVGCSASFHFHP